VGNELADQLAKAGTEQPVIGPEPMLPLGRQRIRLLLRQSVESRWQKRWDDRMDCRQSKEFWPSIDRPRAMNVVRMSKEDYSLFIQYATGHTWLNRHSELLGETDSERCRGCEEASETPLHLLIECPRFQELRDSCLKERVSAMTAWEAQRAVLSKPVDQVQSLIAALAEWFQLLDERPTNTPERECQIIVPETEAQTIAPERGRTPERGQDNAGGDLHCTRSCKGSSTPKSPAKEGQTMVAQGQRMSSAAPVEQPQNAADRLRLTTVILVHNTSQSMSGERVGVEQLSEHSPTGDKVR